MIMIIIIGAYPSVLYCSKVSLNLLSTAFAANTGSYDEWTNFNIKSDNNNTLDTAVYIKRTQ